MSLPQVSREKFEIRTRRLVLRPLQLKDFKAWVTAHDETLPSQSPFDLGPSPKSSRNKAHLKKRIQDEKKLWKKDRHYSLAIFDRKNGAWLGSVALLPRARFVMQTAAIGYSIRNTHWRQGYGSEALRAFLKFAFRDLKFHRLSAEIEEGNVASMKLVKKMGFRKEARIKNLIYINNRWIDMWVYAQTAEEFGIRRSKPVYRLKTADA